jgi:hypothetical protein
LTDFTTTIVPPPPLITQLTAGQGPAGVGLNPAVLNAAEDLVAGQLVNVFSGGARKASNDHSSLPAHGWAAASALAGQPVTINFTGQITGLSGLTVGPVYLGTNGGLTATAPTAASMVQRVGIAVSATLLNFQPSIPVVLSGTPL